MLIDTIVQSVRLVTCGRRQKSHVRNGMHNVRCGCANYHVGTEFDILQNESGERADSDDQQPESGLWKLRWMGRLFCVQLPNIAM
jgi:hypothetical protein